MHFKEGERIQFITICDDSPLPQRPFFPLGGLFHECYPQKPREEVASKGSGQMLRPATLMTAEDAAIVDRLPDDEFAKNDELVLADVTIEYYSPPQEGKDSTLPETDETINAKGETADDRERVCVRLSSHALHERYIETKDLSADNRMAGHSGECALYGEQVGLGQTTVGVQSNSTSIERVSTVDFSCRRATLPVCSLGSRSLCMSMSYGGMPQSRNGRC